MAQVQQDKRRLEILYRQLYSTKSSAYSNLSSKSTNIEQKGNLNTLRVKEDLPKIQMKTASLSFVKKDLIRIFILSSIAILAQLLLYYASARNIISLNLF